jgi:ribosomal-protein-alanine N-acetyltransferase
MIPEGRTEHLLLKPLALADAPQIQAVFPHWEIVKYLAAVVPWPYPPDGADRYLREVALPEMESGSGYHWSIRLAAQPAQIIGCIALFPNNENENRGFWLDPRHQRQGLMTEACAWANDYYFNVLGAQRLRAPKAAANLASRRVSEKQGMRLIHTGEKDYVSGRLPSEIWELTAEEWRAWKARRKSVAGA